MTPQEMYVLGRKTVEKLTVKEDEDTRQELWLRLLAKASVVTEDNLYTVSCRILMDLARAKKIAKNRPAARDVVETDLVVEPMTEGFVMPKAKTPLARKQYRVTARMLAEGYTQREIADRLGVTPMRVCWVVDELRNDGKRSYVWTPADRKAA